MNEHSLVDIPVCSNEAELLKEIFMSFIDISKIKGIIYFDGWIDAETNFGILIYRDFDNKINIVEYGNYNFDANLPGDIIFSPRIITEEEAIKQITQMEQIIGINFDGQE